MSDVSFLIYLRFNVSVSREDGAGFIVNRLLGLYMNEAGRMVMEGQPFVHVDAAMVKFGMPMGPFRYYFLILCFYYISQLCILVIMNTSILFQTDRRGWFGCGGTRRADSRNGFWGSV